jgi:hypothetical protein
MELLEFCPFRELLSIRGVINRGRGRYLSCCRKGIHRASRLGRGTRAESGHVNIYTFPHIHSSPLNRFYVSSSISLISSSFPSPFAIHPRPFSASSSNAPTVRSIEKITYLVEVDNWLPEVVALLVKVSHTDLSEVTWMVLIHVGSVVMLSTSKTSSTGMLAVLSYTAVTGGNVSAAVVLTC